MEIKVHLFSILGDLLPAEARRGQATVSLSDGATVGDLLRQLGVDRRLGCQADEVVPRAGWQVTVNDRYEADPGRVLHDGELVRIFPPVAGG
ncbi:MAG: molybdopterin synthase sulfur carrier subunit [Chloroflexi bacterium]|nr:MAG: molybdopterin synthase sulfur carrier subunit [Chloroflexota bacterium]